MSTDLSHIVPKVKASNISQARELVHAYSVLEMLHPHGILKISLWFDDKKSQYVEQLLLSLHQHHGHQLPIAHSATKGRVLGRTPHHHQLSDCQLSGPFRDNR